jgi:putative transposase
MSCLCRQSRQVCANCAYFELVKVEETLNALLDAEADHLCGARKYERTEGRKDTRAGSYDSHLQTKAGEVTLTVPKLRNLPFETAIIERYRRRESSVEEALIEMYLAGVSVRRVEDITQALWGTRVSASTVSDLNQKIYGKINEWRERPLVGNFPYVFLDGLWLKRSWGGELFVSDKCLGLVENLADFYPDALWQRCVVHFYRNVWTAVPTGKVKEVAAMLKAIHAQEDARAAKEKALLIVEKLRAMRLAKAAEIVDKGIDETLSYYNMPPEHWRCLRTNNPLERLMREIRRRTRVVGAFPDGQSALMLVAARLRHVAATKWGTKRYLQMDRLAEVVAIA